MASSRERFATLPSISRRFNWTRFYEAVADKLLTFRNRRDELISGIHAIASKVAGLSNSAWINLQMAHLAP